MKKSDKENVRTRVDIEGFDYAFVHYSEFVEVKDPKFHEIRQAYIKARKKLADYIGLEE